MDGKFRNELAFLSNMALIDVAGPDLEVYPSVENMYQALKLHPDLRVPYTQINPYEAKKRIRKESKESFVQLTKPQLVANMSWGISEKFSNESFAKKLLAVNPKDLIEENTWHDNFWGNCLCQRCENTPGRNMLGKLLRITQISLR